MSLTYTIDILCDGKDCKEMISTDNVRSASSPAAVVECCYRHGWIRDWVGPRSDDFKYYCPECAKEWREKVIKQLNEGKLFPTHK